MGKNSTGLFHSGQFFKKANLAQVKVCLDAGGRIDGHDEHGNSPLHDAAAYNPNPAITAALLSAGANPQIANKEGETAWDYAQDDPDLKNIFDKHARVIIRKND